MRKQCREAKLTPSNSSSHPLPCCGTECESRGCFVSFHAPNPNTLLQHPDAGCLWASLRTGSTGEPCPLLIPSPGRKTWVHHCLALGAVPSTKVGCSYPQGLCQCLVWHLIFVLIQYRLVGFIEECFQTSFPSIEWIFSCFILTPGLFLFGLSYLPWTP